MNKRTISLLGIFLVLLVGIVQAELTVVPASIDFGTINQGSNGVKDVTITNVGQYDAENITLVAAQFSYNNQFIGTNTFDGQPVFDPNNFNLIPNGSQIVRSTISVPIDAKMGQYTATFTANYIENNVPKTKDIIATVLVNQYTSTAGNLRITSSSFETVPTQMRVGKDYQYEVRVENTGANEVSNVKVISWLYDKSIKQIVAYDESITTSISSGGDEDFVIDLSLSQNLDDDNTYDVYAKAFEVGNEAGQHDVKFKSTDVISEAGQCDIGDLRITDINIEEDVYEPGEDVRIEVDVENKGVDDLEDVIVEVWLTEVGKTQKLEREKSDQFDLDEDDTESLEFELSLDNDLDDGNYEIHIKAYVKGEEDNQCTEELEEIEIERPEHSVVIESIAITPTTLSCDDQFTAEINVQNVGSKEDDAVKIRMINSQLNIDVTSDTFSLDKFDKSGDDETVFLSAQIPKDAEDREYTMTFTLYYDDLDEQKNYVEKITIANCGDQTDTTDDTTTETDEETDNTKADTNDGTKVVYLPTGRAITDFLESDTARTVFWIVADVALLIIAIYFIAALFRRKQRKR